MACVPTIIIPSLMADYYPRLDCDDEVSLCGSLLSSFTSPRVGIQDPHSTDLRKCDLSPIASDILSAVDLVLG
jgi:hypothetical protein